MWLKGFIFNNEILPTNYIIYRNDRVGRGGGVLIAVKENISSKLINCPSNLDLLSVSIAHNKTITINLLYIPPNANVSYLLDIESILHNLNSNENLILLGDFNFPDANWNTMTGNTSSSTNFWDLIFELNLEQLITEPTHKGGNILDVILTNYDCIDNILVSTTLPYGLSSDHYLINFSLKFIHKENLLPYHPESVFDYSHADWDGLLAFLESHDFTSFFGGTDVDAL